MDFVHNEDDFDLLFKQMFREDRAYTEYFSPKAGKIE
jgi:hypothetical protein